MATSAKIVPHLWFDQEAKEAAVFYTSIFKDSKITDTATMQNTPSGDCDVVTFELWNQEFMAISAGPDFKFNPSISFMVNFDPQLLNSSDPKKNAREELGAVWEKLSDGGKVLMPLDKYPFSEHYGWIQDKYGLSWQLILTNPEGDPRPSIMPSMMFVGSKAGKAEEAINLYLSVFKNSKLGGISRYAKGQEPDKEGTVMFADFVLEKQWFIAMDSAHEHQFDFNEAVSLLVNCDDQAEIDHYWGQLSADPAAEQCGWIKDKFGVSWQISPAILNDMMFKGSQEQLNRVTQAFLPMKKMDIAKLKEAYEGKSKLNFLHVSNVCSNNLLRYQRLTKRKKNEFSHCSGYPFYDRCCKSG